MKRFMPGRRENSVVQSTGRPAHSRTQSCEIGPKKVRQVLEYAGHLALSAYWTHLIAL